MEETSLREKQTLTSLVMVSPSSNLLNLLLDSDFGRVSLFILSLLFFFLALAIDMTARNMQDKVKKSGLPWSAAKGFDSFNPISPFIEKSKISDPHNVNLWLKVGIKIRIGISTKSSH